MILQRYSHATKIKAVRLLRYVYFVNRDAATDYSRARESIPSYSLQRAFDACT